MNLDSDAPTRCLVSTATSLRNCSTRFLSSPKEVLRSEGMTDSSHWLLRKVGLDSYYITD
jgi:hypothetical protein